ncbi:phage tail tube protein [Kitasatospora sp. P5_F3]
MTVRPIDARDWLFQVEHRTTGLWLSISGVKSFKMNPSENRAKTETTDFDSNGEFEEDVMQLGGSISLEGQYEADPTTGVQDPGQAYIDTVWALGLSADSHNRMRYRHVTQTTTWAVWDGTVEPGEQGGGNNDKTTWSATVTRSGAVTTMAV